MGTLRIAFLSGMVLELLSTLSVALVAVGIGLRLVEGHLDLVTRLAVLVLAPEVFAPLRAVGAQFHASTDGVAAAQATFAILDEPSPDRSGAAPCADLSRTPVRVEGVSVRIYSLEKTLADMFKFRNKIGPHLAVDALRAALAARRLRKDRLWHFAGLCRVERVMRPYFDALA